LPDDGAAESPGGGSRPAGVTLRSSRDGAVCRASGNYCPRYRTCAKIAVIVILLPRMRLASAKHRPRGALRTKYYSLFDGGYDSIRNSALRWSVPRVRAAPPSSYRDSPSRDGVVLVALRTVRRARPPKLVCPHHHPRRTGRWLSSMLDRRRADRLCDRELALSPLRRQIRRSPSVEMAKQSLHALRSPVAGGRRSGHRRTSQCSGLSWQERAGTGKVVRHRRTLTRL
jgi:hypothetical protein